MCYFQKTKFEKYPERTRIHEDYYRPGETEAEHRQRILKLRREQNWLNRLRTRRARTEHLADSGAESS